MNIFSDEVKIPDKRQRLITSYFEKKKTKPWYNLRFRYRKIFYKGRAMSVTYDMQFVNIKPGTPIAQLFDSLELIFEDIVKRFLSNVEDPARVKLMVILEHEDIDTPIIVPLRFLNDFSAEYVINQIAAVVQSHQSLAFSNQMSVTIGSVTYPRVSGVEENFTPINRNRMSALVNKKFIKIFDDCPPSDKNCLIRSVCYGYFLNKEGAKFWNSRKLKCKNFDKYAMGIAKMCNLDWDTSVGIDDIGKIETALKSKIMLFQFNKFSTGFETMYRGDSEFSQNKIYVLIVPPYNSRSLHAVAVRNPNRLFWSNGKHQIICSHCKDLVKENHMCPVVGKVQSKCYACKRAKCKEFTSGQRVPTITCRLCNHSFLGDDCYLSHVSATERRKHPLCDTRYRCLICHQNSDGTPRNLHVHGMKKCRNCHSQVFDSLEKRHICHLTIGNIVKEKNQRLISLDIESAMDVTSSCDAPDMVNGVCQKCNNSVCTLKIHRPLVIVSFSCCEMCRDRFNNPEGPGDPCESCGWRCPDCLPDGAPICSPRKCDSHSNYCGTRRVTFLGPDCIKLFLDYLLDKRRRNFYCYAHNMSSYDSYFLVQELEQRNNSPSKIIVSGSKIMYFKLSRLNIEFYDSLKILCLPLKLLPKALLNGQYSSEIQKQMFPMRMLNESTLNYIGEYPTEDQYITDRMSKDELSKLRDFLASKKGETFNMRNTVTNYCTTDSYILYLSLLALQDLVISMTSCPHLPNGCDPLRNCVTISSLALKIFRQVYLKEHHLVTLRNTVTDDILVVNAIKQGEQMTFDMAESGQVTGENLLDHEIVSTQLIKSSLKLCPPTHYDPYKRNRYSTEGLACVLYFESKLVAKFGRKCIRSYHVLSNGEKPVYLDKIGSSKTYLDGLFYVQQDGREIVFAINFHGCWCVNGIHFYFRLFPEPPPLYL
mgnify:CR=1 FL=1